MSDTLQKTVDEVLDRMVFQEGQKDLMDMHPNQVTSILCRDNSRFWTYDTSDIQRCVEDYITWYWLNVQFGDISEPRTKKV